MSNERDESKRADGGLEDPAYWDYKRAEVKAPAKAPRIIVSVAFKRDDFALVSQHVERIGKKTSEFIREAAIEKASGQTCHTPVLISMGRAAGAVLVLDQLPAITQALIDRRDQVDPVPMTY